MLRQQQTYDLGRIDWHRVDAADSSEAVIEAARQVSERVTAAERNERDA